MEDIIKQIELIENMELDTRIECFMQLQQVKKLKGLLQEKVKIFSIPIVRQRSELLKGFVDWFNKTDKTQSIINERADEYLKTLL